MQMMYLIFLILTVRTNSWFALEPIPPEYARPETKNSSAQCEFDVCPNQPEGLKVDKLGTPRWIKCLQTDNGGNAAPLESEYFGEGWLFRGDTRGVGTVVNARKMFYTTYYSDGGLSARGTELNICTHTVSSQYSGLMSTTFIKDIAMAFGPGGNREPGLIYLLRSKENCGRGVQSYPYVERMMQKKYCEDQDLKQQGEVIFFGPVKVVAAGHYTIIEGMEPVLGHVFRFLQDPDVDAAITKYFPGVEVEDVYIS